MIAAMHKRTILGLLALATGFLVISAAGFVEHFDTWAGSRSGSVYQPSAFRAMAELESHDFKKAVQAKVSNDHITEYFLDPHTRTAVVEFFSAITASAEISEIILEAATDRNLPPSLVFALVHEESRFNPRALNRNSQTVDRGLFQLNSGSFPKLSVEDFYDPEINTRYGVAHLEHCLNMGGNDVAALAMYNAGYGRVKNTGTPKSTLDYIYRTLNYRSNVEALFEAQVVARIARTIELASARDAAK
jgi:hypothetical protein